ncbi:hypothetical protein CTRI78_v001719 [Colletotrichum trifolii]|uniref:Uncharacterized protein n=1 Tax=Colletotrichum trifolii TaxID=5466 RepID=A0A4R8RSC8_COLTR|nr:hypothetical protein CTRI78_v001719 [Colletotrichum trifolii]
MDVELNKVRVRREEVVQLDPELDMPSTGESLPTSESTDSLSEGQSSSVYIPPSAITASSKPSATPSASSPASPPQSSTPAIVGGVVGGIIVIAIAVCTIAWIIAFHSPADMTHEVSEDTSTV